MVEDQPTDQTIYVVIKHSPKTPLNIKKTSSACTLPPYSHLSKSTKPLPVQKVEMHPCDTGIFPFSSIRPPLSCKTEDTSIPMACCYLCAEITKNIILQQNEV